MTWSAISILKRLLTTYMYMNTRPLILFRQIFVVGSQRNFIFQIANRLTFLKQFYYTSEYMRECSRTIIHEKLMRM